MVIAPPVRRRLVGKALRRHRERLGLTLDDAARVLERDRSRISRIETGERGIRLTELRELLDEYRVEEAQQAVLARLADPRGDFGWHRDYADVLPGAAMDYLILGTAASSIAGYEAQRVPVLVQTPAYARALAKIAAGEPRTKGIEVGERAAADVLTKHSHDLDSIEPYRPAASPGVYVPTTIPTGWSLGMNRPWFMKSAAQFRPGPPPTLTSVQWARDYNEIKALGSATSTVRTSEQTEIARFWATALPDVHLGLARSVATAPGREVTRNARLYAAVTAAMNETETSVFEAKYHYLFWRPITAIRNGDRDGNSATERDPD